MKVGEGDKRKHRNARFVTGNADIEQSEPGQCAADHQKGRRGEFRERRAGG